VKPTTYYWDTIKKLLYAWLIPIKTERNIHYLLATKSIRRLYDKLIFLRTLRNTIGWTSKFAKRRRMQLIQSIQSLLSLTIA